jgi:predicted RecB family nuclease
MPTIIVGTYQITKEQKLALMFAGYVLGKMQKQLPPTGTIVGADGQAHKVGIDSADRTLKPIIDTLRRWANGPQLMPPPMILNKHCSMCQFQMKCLNQAEKDDNLSLLDRMTTKKFLQYQKKGIFTVTQLSYLFKPRRRRKRSSKSPLIFKVELQALALRTGKIYIQEIPELSRQEVELFLDIEGIPDQDFQYLIGLMIKKRDDCSYHSFWANTPEDEQQIWYEALRKINEKPDAPIYHYGSYEPRAIDRLEQKYMTDCEELKNRLVNCFK